MAFSEQTVPLSLNTVVCKVPLWPFGPCQAEVRLLKGMSAALGSASFRWTPIFSGIDQYFGPSSGGTFLNVAGAGFSQTSSYECIFFTSSTGSTAAIRLATPATYVSQTRLSCITPQWPSATVVYATFRVAEQGVILPVNGSTNVLFGFSSSGWVSATPTRMFVGDSISVTVSGRGFNPASTAYLIRFEANGLSQDGPCQTMSNSTLMCTAPVWRGGAAQAWVRIFQSGTSAGIVEVGKFQSRFFMTLLDRWTGIVGASVGAVTGGFPVTLAGTGFIMSSQETSYFCRWVSNASSTAGEYAVVSPATVLNGTRLTCKSPGWAKVESITAMELVDTSNRMVAYTGGASGREYLYVSAWVRANTQTLRTVPPSNVAASVGGTMITIVGLGFSSRLNHTCVLTCAPGDSNCPSGAISNTRATVVSEEMMTCPSPAWQYTTSLQKMGRVVLRLAVLTMNGLHEAYNPTAVESPVDIVLTRAWWTSGGARVIGDASGGNSLTVRGGGFCYDRVGSDCSSTFRCKFVQDTVPTRYAYTGHCVGGNAGAMCSTATQCSSLDCSTAVSRSTWGSPSRILDDSTIVCVVPAWPFPAAKTTFTIWDHTKDEQGQLLGTLGGAFSFEYQLFIRSATPRHVPVTGNSTVAIFGEGFDVNSTSYLCFFTMYGYTVPDPPTLATVYLKPLNDTTLLCPIPPWKPGVSGGDAAVSIVQYDAAGIEIMKAASRTRVIVTYFDEWEGFSACQRTDGLPCKPTSAPAFGSFRLDMVAQGMDPTLEYTVVFSTGLDLATSNYIIVPLLFDSPIPYHFSRVYCDVPGWNYPVATTIVRVYVTRSGRQSLVRVSPRYGKDNVLFTFTQMLTNKSMSVIPPVGCGGACWPHQFDVYGRGFLPNSPNVLAGDAGLNYTDYVCKLYPTVTGSPLTSIVVRVLSDNTLRCTFGQVGNFPVYITQMFRLEVEYRGENSTWSLGSNPEIFLTDAWSTTDCQLANPLSTTPICEGFSSGGFTSTSFIMLVGFGYDTRLQHFCRWTRSDGVFVQSAPALPITSVRILCQVQEWPYPESEVRLSLHKLPPGNNSNSTEVKYDGFGQSGDQRRFRYIASWWFDTIQNSSVAGSFAVGQLTWPGPDRAMAPLVFAGRGFDPGFRYYVRFSGLRNNGGTAFAPSIPITNQFLNASSASVTTSELVLRVPEYSGYEGPVFVQVFKCTLSTPMLLSICTEVRGEPGGTVAYRAKFPGVVSTAIPPVIRRFDYLATVVDASMTSWMDVQMQMQQKCYPHGIYLCYVPGTGGKNMSVHGYGFRSVGGAKYTCKFTSVSSQNGTYMNESISFQAMVSGDVLSCLTPIWPGPEGLVHVSLVSYQPTRTGSYELPQHSAYNLTTILVSAAVASLQASVGPATSALVTVIGAAFDSEPDSYTCVFTSSEPAKAWIPPKRIIAPALYVSSTEIVCDVGDMWGSKYPGATAQVYVGRTNDTTSLAVEINDVETRIQIMDPNAPLPWTLDSRYINIGTYIRVADEIMLVTNISNITNDSNSSDLFDVARGVGGTRAVRHVVGESVEVFLPNAINTTWPSFQFVPSVESVNATEAFSYGGTLVEVISGGLDVTFLPTARKLDALTASMSDLRESKDIELRNPDIPEYYGMMFDVFANHSLNINSIELSAKMMEEQYVWIFARKCPSGVLSCGFRDLRFPSRTEGAWEEIPLEQEMYNFTESQTLTVDLAGSGLNIPAGQTRGLLVFIERGIMYGDTLTPGTDCPRGVGVDCVQWEDSFLRVTPGVLVTAEGPYMNFTAPPLLLLATIGTDLVPRFFAGAFRYTNQLVGGTYYSCKFTNAKNETALSLPTRAFAISETSLSTALPIKCVVPFWPHGEGRTDLTLVETDNPNATEVASSFEGSLDAWLNFTILATWHEMTGQKEGSAGGGDLLVLSGLGFDSTEYAYKCRFYSPQSGHKEYSPVTVVSTTEARCTTPKWLDYTPQTALLDIVRNITNATEESTVAWAFGNMTREYELGNPGEKMCEGTGCDGDCIRDSCVHDELLLQEGYEDRNFTFREGWVSFLPTSASASGGIRFTVFGAGFDGKAYTYSCLWSAVVGPTAQIFVDGTVSSTADEVACGIPTGSRAWDFLYKQYTIDMQEVSRATAVTVWRRSRDAGGALDASIADTTATGGIINLNNSAGAPQPDATGYVIIGSEVLQYSWTAGEATIAITARSAFGTEGSTHDAGASAYFVKDVRRLRDVGNFSFDFLQWTGFTVPGSPNSSGPAQGGTTLSITGVGFRQEGLPDDVFLCKFVRGDAVMCGEDAIINSSTVLTCTTPEWGASEAAQPYGNSSDRVQLVLSRKRTNNCTVNPAEDDSVPVQYTAGQPTIQQCGDAPRCSFLFVPSVTDSSPANGSALGGTLINITGFGFDDLRSYYCVFVLLNNGVVVAASKAAAPAEADSPTLMQCTAPKWNYTAGLTNLYLSLSEDPAQALNATAEADQLTFEFLQGWTGVVAPSEGVARGGTIVTIGGAGFQPTKSYQCVFKLPADSLVNITVEATFVSTVFLTCTTSKWRFTADLTEVELRLAGDAYVPYSGPDPNEFTFLQGWDQLSTATIFIGPDNYTGYVESPATGKTLEESPEDLYILVEGFGFNSSHTYKCFFDELESPEVEVLSSEYIRCRIPPWGSTNTYATVYVSLSIDQDMPLLLYDNTFTGETLCANASDPTVCSFTFFEVVSNLITSTATAAGGLSVFVSVSGFETNHTLYFCSWTGSTTSSVATVDASASVPNRLTCPSPVWTFGEGITTFEVFRHADPNTPIPSERTLKFSFTSGWSSVSPRRGAAKGGVNITLTGDGFEPGATDYRCVFTATIPLPDSTDTTTATVQSNGTVLGPKAVSCITPPWPYPSAVTRLSLIRMSATGSNTTVSPVGSGPFTYTMSAGWDMLNTSQTLRLPAEGNSEITILGYGLDYTDSYTCIFTDEMGNSKSSEPSTDIQHDVLRCTTPVWGDVFTAATVNVTVMQVSSNEMIMYTGGRLTEQLCPMNASCSLFFYAILSGQDVQSGLAFGGDTILFSGFGFDVLNSTQEYTCLFINTLNNDSATSVVVLDTPTSLACTTPRWNFPHVTTSIVISNGTNEIPSTSPLTFEFLEAWNTTDITEDPGRGDTEMTVAGAGFDPLTGVYTCWFTQTDVSPVRVVYSTAFDVTHMNMSCKVPLWPFAYATVTVTLRNNDVPLPTDDGAPGRDFTMLEGWDYRVDGTLVLNATLNLTGQTEGPADGNTTVVLKGFGFDEGAVYACNFSAGDNGTMSSASAVAVRYDAITCTTPDWGQLYVATTVQIDLLRDSNSIWLPVSYYGLTSVEPQPTQNCGTSCQFTFYPVIVTISPTVSGAFELLTVTVIAKGLNPEQEYFCRFTKSETEYVDSSPVKPIDVTTLECVAPAWPYGTFVTNFSLHTADLNVMVAYQNFATFPKFKYNGNWLSKDVSTGPAKGGTTIMLTTSGIVSTDNFVCRFTTMDGEEVEAVAVPENSTLVCITPDWPYPAVDTNISVHVVSGSKQDNTYEEYEMMYFGNESETQRLFTFYQGWDSYTSLSPPSTHTIYPSVWTTRGPASGGSVITIHGYGLDWTSSAYECVFTRQDGSTMSAPANTIINSTTELNCTTPSWGSAYSAGAVQGLVGLGVRLAVNPAADLPFTNEGMEQANTSLCADPSLPLSSNCSWEFFPLFASAEAFEADPTAAQQPAFRSVTSFMASGGQTFTVPGYGYDVDQTYNCEFQYADERAGGAMVKFSTGGNIPSNSTHLDCETPLWDFRHVGDQNGTSGAALNISLDQANDTVIGDISMPRRYFSFYPVYTELTPTNTSSKGNSTVTLSGLGFDTNDINMMCLFEPASTPGEYVLKTRATVQSTSEITCPTPEWSDLDHIERDAQVILQGAPNPAPDPFNLTFFPEWTSLRPRFADRLGGTNGGLSPAITISGFGFNPSYRYQCSFMLAASQDEVLSSSVLRPISPKTTVCIPNAVSADGYKAFTKQLRNVTLLEIIDGVSLPVYASSSSSVSFVNINKRPAFVGSTHRVPAQDAEHVINPWATRVRAGVYANGTTVPEERDQRLTFVARGPGSFTVAPNITMNADGVSATLRFRAPKSITGEFVIWVFLRDDGGTANGGVDRSAQQSFRITIYEVQATDFSIRNTTVNITEDASNTVLHKMFEAFVSDLGIASGSEFLQSIIFNVTVNGSAVSPYFSVFPTIDINTGSMHFAPALDAFTTDAGIEVLIVKTQTTLATGQTFAANKTFTLVILPVNDQPRFMIEPNVTSFLEDECTATPCVIANFTPLVNLSKGPRVEDDGPEGEDWDESDQELSFNVTDIGAAFAPGYPIFDGITGSLEFQLKPDRNSDNSVASSLSFTLVVEDDGGGTPSESTFSQNFTLTVKAVNDPPYSMLSCKQTVAATVDSHGINCDDCTAGDDPNGCSITITVFQSCSNCGQTASPSTSCRKLSIPALFTGILPYSRNGSYAAKDEWNQTVYFENSNSTGSVELFEVPPSVDPTGNFSFCLDLSATDGTASFWFVLRDELGAVQESVSNDTEIEGFQIRIVVRSVNQPPTLTLCPTCLGEPSVVMNENSGILEVANFSITDFGDDALPENDEKVATYIVDMTNVTIEKFVGGAYILEPGFEATKLFEDTPELMSNGTLLISLLPGVAGMAKVHVYVEDNGGTENGGFNRSQVEVFTVYVIRTYTNFTLKAQELTVTDATLLALRTAIAKILNVDISLVILTTTTPVTRRRSRMLLSTSSTTVTVTVLSPFASASLLQSQNFFTQAQLDSLAAVAGANTGSITQEGVIVSKLSVETPRFEVSNSTVTFNEFEYSDDNSSLVIQSFLYDIVAAPNVPFTPQGRETVYFVITPLMYKPFWGAPDWETNTSDLAILSYGPIIASECEPYCSNASLTLRGTPYQNGEILFDILMNYTDPPVRQNFTVQVVAVNVPPVIPEQFNFTVGEALESNTTVNFSMPGILAGMQKSDVWFQKVYLTAVNGTGDDILDGDPKFYPVQPKNSSADDRNATILFTLKPGNNGVRKYALCAEDDDPVNPLRTCIKDGLVITVNPLNNPPTFIVAVPVVNFVEDDLENVTIIRNFLTNISKGSAADEGNQNLTYSFAFDANYTNQTNKNLIDSASGLPELSIWPNGTATLFFKLKKDENGVAYFKVMLLDDGPAPGSGESLPVPFAINVTQVNDAPTFVLPNALPTFIEAANETFVSVPGFAVDLSAGAVLGAGKDAGLEDSQGITFNFTAMRNAGDNTELFAVQPTLGADGVLNFTLVQDANGRAGYLLTLLDDGVPPQSTTVNMTFIVQAVNNMPTFIINETDYPGYMWNITENLTAAEIRTSLVALSITTGPPDEVAEPQPFNFTVNTTDQDLRFSPSHTAAAGESSLVMNPAINSNGVLTFTTPKESYGTAYLNITLTDSVSQQALARYHPDSSLPRSFTLPFVVMVQHKASFRISQSVVVDEDTDLHIPIKIADLLSPAYPEDGSSPAYEFNISSTLPEGHPFASDPSVIVMDTEGNGGYVNFSLIPNANFDGVPIVIELVYWDTTDRPLYTSLTLNFTITITPVNDPPTFSVVSDVVEVEEQSTLTPQAVSLLLVTNVQDVEGSMVNFTFRDENGIIRTEHPLFETFPNISVMNTSAGETEGNVTFTPKGYKYGNVTFTLVAWDGTDEAVIVHNITFVIESVNQRPMYTGGNTTLAVCETQRPQEVAKFVQNVCPGDGPPTIPACDPNEIGEDVTFVVVPPASAVNIFNGFETSDVRVNATSGNLSFNVRPELNGTYELYLTDGMDNSSSTYFDLIVDINNDAPYFSLPANRTALDVEVTNTDTFTNTVAFAYNISAGPGEALQQLTFRIQHFEEDDTLFTEIFTGEPSISASGDLTYTLRKYRFGTVRFNVSLHDDGGKGAGVCFGEGVDESPWQNFSITVVPVNQRPTFNVATAYAGTKFVQFKEGETKIIPNYVINISRGEWNEDSQTVWFVVDHVLGYVSVHRLLAIKLTAPNSTTAYLEFRGMPNRFGNLVYRATLYDEKGGFSSTEFSVRVLPVNDPPTFFLADAHVLVGQDTACTNEGLEFQDPVSICNGTASKGTLAHTHAGFILGRSLGPFEDGPDVCPQDHLQFGWGCESQSGFYTVTAASASDARAAGLLFSSMPEIIFENGTLRFTLRKYATGKATFRVVLTDTGALDKTKLKSEAMFFTLEVVGINKRPSFNMIDNVTVTEDSGPFEMARVATNMTKDNTSDNSEAAQKFAFEVTVDHPELFSKRPAIAPNGTLTFALAKDQFGVAVLTVVLRDDGGDKFGGFDVSDPPQYLTIYVLPIDDPPTFAINSIVRVNEGAGPAIVVSHATSISPGPSNENCRVANDFCQSQRLTFVFDDISNPVLFAQLPHLTVEGTLSFRVKDDATGSSVVTVRLEDDGRSIKFAPKPSAFMGNYSSIRQSFTIQVDAVNDEPTFRLPWTVSCLSVELRGTMTQTGVLDCSCPPFDGPSPSPYCLQKVPGDVSASDLNISRVYVPQGSKKTVIRNMAAHVTPARGFLPASEAVFTLNNADGSLRYSHLRSDPIMGSPGLENAIEYAASPDGKHLYAVEFEISALSVFDAATMELIDRRQDGERRLRFVGLEGGYYNATPREVQTSAVCGLTAFLAGNKTYVAAASGCALLDDMAEKIANKNQDAMDGVCARSQLTQGCDQGCCNALLADTVGLWDLNSKSLYGQPGRINHLRRGSTECKLSGMHLSEDGLPQVACTYFRQANRDACSEAYDTSISPSTVRDQAGTLGAAILMGPLCKTDTQSDWDADYSDPSTRLLSAVNFLVNNGEEEAMQFDGVLNEGLFITDDIDPLVDGTPASRLPLNQLAVEVWFSVDRPEVPYAGLVAVQQAGPGCAKGWSLAYDMKYDGISYSSTLYFAVSTEANAGALGEGALTFAIFPTDTALEVGAWYHLVGMYNGTSLILYLNGKMVRSVPACEGGGSCGNIIYPAAYHPMVRVFLDYSLLCIHGLSVFDYIQRSFHLSVH